MISLLAANLNSENSDYKTQNPSIRARQQRTKHT